MVFYENALALNNVCLEVGEGEIVGIVGSNGAGKSTLMYTISGIMLDRKVKEERRGGERITMLGRITHRGESIAQLPPWERVKRGVVLCPERRRVFPESSVIENLRIGAHTSASHSGLAITRQTGETFLWISPKNVVCVQSAAEPMIQKAALAASAATRSISRSAGESMPAPSARHRDAKASGPLPAHIARCVGQSARRSTGAHASPR